MMNVQATMSARWQTNLDVILVKTPINVLVSSLNHLKRRFVLAYQKLFTSLLPPSGCQSPSDCSHLSLSACDASSVCVGKYFVSYEDGKP